MKENIETKDVQRTEYLDKNGLDMLWVKVKENTHNQVEVEYNRAQAVEGDITNKLNNLKYIPYVSKNNMSSTELGDFVKYQLGATEFIISAQSGSNDARTEFRFGEVKFISISKDSAVSIDYKGVTAGLDNNIKLTNTGIRKYINTNTPAGSATEAFSTDGGVIDTTAFALKSELDSYAKKTDIPEVDTSDFVIKTTRDIQTIKAPLTVTGNLQVNAIDNKPYAFLSATQGFGQLHLFNKATSARSYLEGGSLQINEGSDDGIRITCQGIRNLDNNANHVFATDGSIADLTQYIKKGDTDVKFVPYVKKDLNSYNSAEAYYLGNDIQFGGSHEYHTVIGSTAFDARYGNHCTNLNVDSTADYAVNISNLGTSRSVKVVWDTMKLAFTPKDNNVDSGTTYSLAGIHLPANLSSKKPENTLVLGTDEDYKEIGVDIAPLENGKVPTKYLTSATKESLGVVKVGDGLNVTDGTISVDTTAIGAGNYIPYARYENDEYIMLNDICTERAGIKSRIGNNGLSVYKMTNQGIYSNIQCAKIELQSDKNRIRINDDVIDVQKLDNSAIGGTSYCVFGLSKYGVILHGGDDNHVLTSNASTIDITQYALKSVYDEKIAALEARIAALEAKHAEAAA